MQAQAAREGQDRLQKNMLTTLSDLEGQVREMFQIQRMDTAFQEIMIRAFYMLSLQNQRNAYRACPKVQLAAALQDMTRYIGNQLGALIPQVPVTEIGMPENAYARQASTLSRPAPSPRRYPPRQSPYENRERVLPITPTNTNNITARPPTMVMAPFSSVGGLQQQNEFRFEPGILSVVKELSKIEPAMLTAAHPNPFQMPSLAAGREDMGTGSEQIAGPVPVRASPRSRFSRPPALRPKYLGHHQAP
jgi:hypothetical protein